LMERIFELDQKEQEINRLLDLLGKKREVLDNKINEIDSKDNTIKKLEKHVSDITDLEKTLDEQKDVLLSNVRQSVGSVTLGAPTDPDDFEPDNSHNQGEKLIKLLDHISRAGICFQIRFR